MSRKAGMRRVPRAASHCRASVRNASDWIESKNA